MKKAIFWDRDGTLIEHNSNSYYTVLPEHIVLKPHLEKIAVLQKYYLFFIITNGGGIGKGDYTVKEFWEGQNHFEALASEKGINFIETCPSFWNKKNPENFLEYKDLRKPSPILIQKLCKKYGPIDLSNSYVVGDSNYDMELAVNAGCKKIFIKDDHNDPKYAEFGNTHPEFIAENLEEVVQFLKR